MLIVEVGSISIKLSEYRVLCIHAVEQAGVPLILEKMLTAALRTSRAI